MISTRTAREFGWFWVRPDERERQLAARGPVKVVMIEVKLERGQFEPVHSTRGTSFKADPEKSASVRVI